MAQEWEERCQLYIDVAINKLEPLAKQGVLGGEAGSRSKLSSMLSVISMLTQ